MIKFTDEQKRELLKEYIEIYTKAVDYMTELRAKLNLEVVYEQEAEYQKTVKLLAEAEQDFTKLTDEQWEAICLYVIAFSKSKKNEAKEGFSNTGWIGLIALMALNSESPTNHYYHGNCSEQLLTMDEDSNNKE